MSPALAAALLLPATLCFMVGVFFGTNIVALGFAGAAVSMFAAVITGLEFLK